MQKPLLVLDTASPTVSVAVGTAGDAAGGPADAVLAARNLELRRSSETLLAAVDACLGEAGSTLRELGGVAALRGPGSFTGLRIGLATVLGWHQALGIRATALPTLEVLASLAPDDGDVIAAVDALRGDWHAQLFPAGRDAAPSRLWSGAEILAHGPCRVVGFGVGRLAELPQWDAAGDVELLEPESLAVPALALAAAAADDVDAWDPRLLLEPLYSRPPAVTPPRTAAG